MPRTSSLYRGGLVPGGVQWLGDNGGAELHGVVAHGPDDAFVTCAGVPLYCSARCHGWVSYMAHLWGSGRWRELWRATVMAFRGCLGAAVLERRGVASRWRVVCDTDIRFQAEARAWDVAVS